MGTEPPDSENNQRWKRMTVDEKAAIAQDMIDKMGLNINVYRSDAEVPNYVKKRRSGSVPLGILLLRLMIWSGCE